MNPYIGDRQIDPDEEDIECPCGSHVYTAHGFCMHCEYPVSDSLQYLNDPGEPNEEPQE